MPLKPGNSRETVSQNISEFHTGPTYAHTAAKFGKKRANAQAIAVAMSEARKYAEGGEVEDQPIDKTAGISIRSLAEDPAERERVLAAARNTANQYGGAFGTGSPAEEMERPNLLAKGISAYLGHAWEGFKQGMDTFQAPAGLRRQDITDIPGTSEPLEEQAQTGIGMAIGTVGAPLVGATPGVATLGAGAFPKAAFKKAAMDQALKGDLSSIETAKALKEPYPKDVAQEAIDNDLNADQLNNVASHLSPGAQKAFWKWHQKLSEEAPAKEMFSQVLDHTSSINASDFLLEGPLGEKAASAVKLAMESKTPKFIAEQIHKKNFNGKQLDNVLSYIPEDKHLDVLSNLVDLEEADLKKSQAAFTEFNPPPPSAPKSEFSNFGAPINPDKMEMVPNSQHGSNPGAEHIDPKTGKKFYIKQEPTPGHAANEMLAAKLYDLAGAKTLKYRPVEGGGKIATEWTKLDVDNANKFTKEQKEQAQQDFAIHAWLANWDAVGLGGDNQAIVHGHPTTVDVGASLEYRAQGAPKGNQFGNKVGEIDSFLDGTLNPDSTKFFGDMSFEDMRNSAKRVVSIPDQKIIDTVFDHGKGNSVARKLLLRKDDLAKRFGIEKIDPDYKLKQGKFEQTPYEPTDWEKKYPEDPHAPQDWEPSPGELEGMGFLDTSTAAAPDKYQAKIASHLTPVKDWTAYRPHDHTSMTYRKTIGDWVDPAALPKRKSIQDKIDFGPNDPKKLEKEGWNTHFLLWKSGNIPNPHPLNPEYPHELIDPLKTKHYSGEPGLFFADTRGVAEGYSHYGKLGKPYLVRPKHPVEIDYRNTFGSHYYGGEMGAAISQARKKGADLVIVHRIDDNARSHSHKVHTQYVVLDTSILRAPDAKFAPEKAHTRDPLSGIAVTLGTGAAAYGASRGNDQTPEGMKRGGIVLDRALREAKKYASGGVLDESRLGRLETHVPHPEGMLDSSVPGRTDKLPISVKAGSYVVPADTISALGEGNTLGGNEVMKHVIRQARVKGMGAMKVPGPPKVPGKVGPKIRMRSARTIRMAYGGLPVAPAQNQHIPIIAAGGEFVIPPEDVTHIGGGDLTRGHNALDKFVLKTRRELRQKLGKLKPPKVD